MQLMLGLLLLIFVVIPALLFYGVRAIAFRALPRDSAGRTRAVTPVGFVVYGLMVLLLIGLLAASASSGSVGHRLRQPGVLVAGIVILTIAGGLVEWVLRKLRRPTTRSMPDRDV